MGVQNPVNQRNQGDGEPLEVNRGGGEECLDAHVIETAPDGTRKTMPGFGFAMDAFDPPAVTLIEPFFSLTPPQPSTPRP